jgi:branched-chain amino acid transport system substrate-binding protein
MNEETGKREIEKRTDQRKNVSRRDFLKLAGIGGAAVAVGSGLGSFLAGCGEEETTTTTAAASTTSPAAASTTTVASEAEMGREVKIGIVIPVTGPLAAFGIADEWSKGLAAKYIGDGIVLGDSKKHPITIESRDSQSDSNRAASVAAELVQNVKVDILMASGTPDTANPAADQAEALECPFLSNYSPWNAFVWGRGATDLTTPFKWTYGHLLGTEQMMHCLCASYEQIPNNKRVAFLTMNNADGNAWLDEQSGAPVVLKKYGYEIVAAGQYNPGSEDFTAEISLFKKEGCDVLSGACLQPDFINFWKQSLQQGFNPKIPSMGLAIDFPQAFEGLGTIGYGLLGEQSWNPTFPFTDTLTGMTCQQLADQFEADTNTQWTPAIGQLAKVSWAVDVLQRVKDVDDKESILDAIKTTKMDTILGPIDFTSPLDADPTAPDSYRPHPNVCKPVYTGGQWLKGEKWDFDQFVVSNPCAPMVATQAVEPYVY